MLIKERYKYDLFLFLESSFRGYWVGFRPALPPPDQV